MKPLTAAREYRFGDDVYSWNDYNGCYYLSSCNWRKHSCSATHIAVAQVMVDAAGKFHAMLYYPAFAYLGAYHDVETALERVNDVVRKEHEEKAL